MSEMIGALLSSAFHVKSERAFRAWLETYYFGENLRFFTAPSSRDDRKGVRIGFGSEERYPLAYPRMNDAGPDHPEHSEADLERFAAGLRAHLLPDEIVYVVAGGNEKLRYVGFTELAVSHDQIRYRHTWSDDLRCARELLAIPLPKALPSPDEDPRLVNNVCALLVMLRDLDMGAAWTDLETSWLKDAIAIGLEAGLRPAEIDCTYFRSHAPELFESNR